MFKRLKLDPRTSIILLLLVNIFFFKSRSLASELILMSYLLIILTVCGNFKPGLKVYLTFITFLIINYLVFPYSPKWIVTTFIVPVSYARKIFPCIMAGTLLYKTVTVREIAGVFRKFKFSENFILAFMITYRYFPTLRQDIHCVRESMKIRGISMIKNMDIFVVPIINSAIDMSEELSKAAVTRGVENPGRKTTIIDFKFTVYDVLVILFVVLIMVIF